MALFEAPADPEADPPAAEPVAFEPVAEFDEALPVAEPDEAFPVAELDEAPPVAEPDKVSPVAGPDADPPVVVAPFATAAGPEEVPAGLVEAVAPPFAIELMAAIVAALPLVVVEALPSAPVPVSFAVEPVPVAVTDEPVPVAVTDEPVVGAGDGIIVPATESELGLVVPVKEFGVDGLLWPLLVVPDPLEVA